MRSPLYGHFTPNLRKVYSKTDPENNLGFCPVHHCVLNENLLDLTELVRSIQRSEGNTDCFRRHVDDCDQLSCTWRSLCLEQQDNGRGYDEEDPITT